MRKILIILLILVQPITSAAVTLLWDEPNSTEVIGYNVYRELQPCSYSGPLNFLMDVGKVATIEDTNVPDGPVCYEVTAYDSNRIESPRSNRAGKVVDNPPDTPKNVRIVTEGSTMGADFRSINNTTYAVRTNTTVTAPAGIQNGDVLFYVLFIGLSGTPPTPTPPAGFSLPNGGTWPIPLSDGSFGVRIYVWYKIASNESGNYTATHSSSTTQGVMFSVQGGSNSAPNTTTNPGLGSTTTALGLTTTGPNALIVFISWDWGDTFNNLSPPSGSTPTFTEKLDVAPLTYIASGVLASAGATGNKTITNNTASGSYPNAGVLIAIEALNLPSVSYFKRHRGSMAEKMLAFDF